MAIDLPCPSPALLERYSTGVLDPEESSELEIHLLECADCSKTVSGLRTSGLSSSHTSVPRVEGDAFGEEQLSERDEHPPGAIPPFVEPVEVSMIPGRGQAEANDIGFCRKIEEPSSIGPYRILERIGTGGMGVIYRAVHVKLEKPVALKLLPAALLTRQAWVDRFEREMKALGRLEHPNVVRAHDAGAADGIYYLAMDLIEGMDLQILSRRRGPLPVADASEIARQAAEGLSYIHGHALVHRDIKPSNLMLTTGGQVKILDLGLALLTGGESDAPTSRGVVLGTYDYIAPEQASDSHRVDHRADIYSLGCSLYQLLAGRPPFARMGSTPVQRIMAHAKSPLPPLEKERRDLPAGLVRLVRRMTAKSPSKRPGSAREVADRLGEYSGGARIAALLEFPGATDAAGEPGATVARQEPCRLHVPSRGAGILRKCLLALLSLVLSAVAVAAAPTLYRVVTNQGELAVEIDDGVTSDVEVRVLGRDVSINSKTGWSIDLKAGEYRLELRETGDELALSRDSVTVTRAGKVIVRVKRRKASAEARDAGSPARTPAAAPAASSPPRAPGTWRPGSADRAFQGLVPLPANLPGIGRWQVESTFPRAAFRAAWSPDGKFLAAIGYRTVRIYELVDGRLRLVEHFDTLWWMGWGWAQAWRVSWSPDGKWLALLGGQRNGCLFWNRVEKKLGRSINYRWVSDWSPDGRWLATGDGGGVVRLEAPDEGATKTLPHLDSGTVRLLAWSPDGAWLATGGDEKGIRLWDSDGAPGPLLEGHEAAVTALDWSRDGRRLCSGSRDGTIRVWTVKGSEVATLRGQGAPMERVGFSPDGSRIASLAGDAGDPGKGTCRLWDPAEGRALLELPRIGLERVDAYSWSPDGRWLATGDWDGRVRLWDGTDGKPGPVFQWLDRVHGGVAAVVHEISWHPLGKVFATSSWDATLRLWDLESGREFQSLPAAPSHARSVAWSPDGRWIATAGQDHTIRLFAPDTGEPRPPWSGHEGPVNDVAWSPGSDRLASASDDGTVRICRVPDGGVESVLQAGAGAVHSIAWGPGGQPVASGHADGLIRLWSPGSATPERELPGHGGPVTALAFSQDGRRLASGSGDGCRVWQLTEAAPPTLFRRDRTVRSLSFSPDGNRLAAGGDESCQVWEVASGREAFRTATESGFHTVAWSPNESWIALGSYDKVAFADAGTGAVRSSVAGHAFFVSSLSWSPDGMRLASAATDHTVRVWNVAAVEPLWFAVLLPGGNFVVFNGAGETLHRSGPEADQHLLYVTEKDDGSLEWLGPEAFAARIRGALLIETRGGDARVRVRRAGLQVAEAFPGRLLQLTAGTYELDLLEPSSGFHLSRATVTIEAGKTASVEVKRDD